MCVAQWDARGAEAVFADPISEPPRPPLNGGAMPRIRSLKPEHRQHRKVGSLSDFDYRLWVGMLCEADDEGRLIFDPGQLRILVFPYQPRITTTTIIAGARRVAQVGLIRLYSVNGTTYADFPSWKDHQKIDRPTRSRLPTYESSSSTPPLFDEPSTSPRESSTSPRRGSEGSEGSKRSEGGKESRESSTSPRRAIWSTDVRPGEIAAGSGRKVLDAALLEAVKRTTQLQGDPRLLNATWWSAAVEASPDVDHIAEIPNAELWLLTKGDKRKDMASFLGNWLKKAQADVEPGEIV